MLRVIELRESDKPKGETAYRSLPDTHDRSADTYTHMHTHTHRYTYYIYVYVSIHTIRYMCSD